MISETAGDKIVREIWFEAVEADRTPHDNLVCAVECLVANPFHQDTSGWIPAVEGALERYLYGARISEE